MRWIRQHLWRNLIFIIYPSITFNARMMGMKFPDLMLPVSPVLGSHRTGRSGRLKQGSLQAENHQRQNQDHENNRGPDVSRIGEIDVQIE